MKRLEDLTGRKVGRLTVLEFVGFAERESYSRDALWLCQCKCGKTKTLRACNLQRGTTRSCGCLQLESRSKHGLTRDYLSEYRTWNHAIYRCHNPKCACYAGYGGRGIRVCRRWRGRRTGFPNFLADMGPRPSPLHSLDRIDNNRGYSPDNCRWTSNKIQQRNRRSNRFLTYRGKRQLLIEWEDQLGFRRGALALRLLRGWSIDRALTTPVKHKTPRRRAA